MLESERTEHEARAAEKARHNYANLNEAYRATYKSYDALKSTHDRLNVAYNELKKQYDRLTADKGGGK
jgi:hypothetical protein